MHSVRPQGIVFTRRCQCSGPIGIVFRVSGRSTVHCYTHRDRQAVGACKACSKGVCGDCARDCDGGLACSDRCVTEVAEFAAMVEHSKRLAGLRGRRVSIVVLVFGGSGICLAVLGALAKEKSANGFILGGLFLLLALVAWLRQGHSNVSA